jgi:DNA-binding IclR family transcriptional regulator
MRNDGPRSGGGWLDGRAAGLPGGGTLERDRGPDLETWPQIGPTVVKSAGRVLQVLEFFACVRRSATLAEISKALSYPLSSTSALLRSLVSLGYVSFDRQARSYCPSIRIPLLGSWIDSGLSQDGGLAELMNELSCASQQLVVLAMRNGLSAQYIYVVPPPSTLLPCATPGTARSIAKSAAGLVMLSQLPEFEVRKLVRRLNAETPRGDSLVDMTALLARLEEVRSRGYAVVVGEIAPEHALLAAPLPLPYMGAPLVVAFGGPAPQILARQACLAAVIRERAARCAATPSTANLSFG